MIERLLHRVLTQKIEDLAGDERTLRGFLRTQVRLRSEEEDKLVEVFRETPFTVYQDLARTQTLFPNIVIAQGAESELDPEGTFLNGDGGSLGAAELDEIGLGHLGSAEYSMSLYRGEYTLDVHAAAVDVCIVGYQITKALLTLARPLLNAEGVLQQTISGLGVQHVNRQDSSGDQIFRRRLRLRTVEAFQVIDYGQAFGDFTHIEGVHVRGGSTSPVGQVTTLVDPYLEGAE